MRQVCTSGGHWCVHSPLLNLGMRKKSACFNALPSAPNLNHFPQLITTKMKKKKTSPGEGKQDRPNLDRWNLQVPTISASRCPVITGRPGITRQIPDSWRLLLAFEIFFSLLGFSQLILVYQFSSIHRDVPHHQSHFFLPTIFYANKMAEIFSLLSLTLYWLNWLFAQTAVTLSAFDEFSVVKLDHHWLPVVGQSGRAISERCIFWKIQIFARG